MPDVTWEAVWDVLKWVLLVLAAGFIGQFGKMLAQRLIERRRRKKLQSDPVAPSAPTAADVELEKSRIAADGKIEKKRAKADVKRAKNPDDDPPS